MLEQFSEDVSDPFDSSFPSQPFSLSPLPTIDYNDYSFSSTPIRPTTFTRSINYQDTSPEDTVREGKRKDSESTFTAYGSSWWTD